MRREVLVHLPVVVAVAERGGFAAAAARLGMSASAVSHAVRVVETHLGVPLFLRTTRQVELTDAGRTLLEAAQPALRELEEGLERVTASRGEVTGHLRLNVPRVACALGMDDVVAHLAAAHPRLVTEVVLDDALVDILAEGFDAGVRLGNMVGQEMVAVRLTPPVRAIVVGSPDYLARRGRPRSLAALAKHACINYRQVRGGGLYKWELQHRGEDVQVAVDGPAIVQEPLHARAMARNGLGLAYLFEPLVREDLASGRLVQVLPKAAIEEPGLFVYFPRRASAAPKVAAFVAAVRHVAARQAE